MARLMNGSLRSIVTKDSRLPFTVIGGLFVATMATLIVLPCVYAILQKGASELSPSLDPNDPSSRYYEAT